MRAAPLLAALLLAGCFGIGVPDAEPTPATGTPTPASPTPQPPLFFGGIVVDARTGAPIEDARVRLDLAQTRPCGQQGIGWTSWEPPVANGAWGPLEVPRPRSDDVAFFLHAVALGYAENATYIGPTQARGDIRNMTVVLHEDAAIEGVAEPGAVVALDAPDFPRFAIANETGAWRFERARVLPATLVVAGAGAPLHAVVAAPATLADNGTRAAGWSLEGTLRGPKGEPLAGDVAAWNGTALWSAGRAGDNGVFVLPLPAEPVALRIEARAAEGRYGAVKLIEIDGPPATRVALAAALRC